MINGFLTAISLENHLNKNETLVSWYSKKLIRLLPIYWFFTVVYLLVFPSTNVYWLGNLKGLSLWNIFANFLLLHGFHPYYINSININWFVANITIWYLIFPFIWKYLRSFKNCIYVLSIYITVFFIYEMFISNLSLNVVIKYYFSYFSFIAQFPVMLMGVIVYHLNNDTRLKRKKQYIFFLFLLYGLLSIIFSKKVFYSHEIIGWGLLFLIIFWSQLTKALLIFNNKLFSLFGKYSYGIYLSHLIIHYIVVEILNKIPFFLSKNILIILSFSITIFISLITSMFLEFIQRKLFSYIKKIKNKSAYQNFL